MKFAFRADSSIQIGNGHVMRCLTLAKELKNNSIEQCYFIMRDHQGNLAQYVKNQGFEVYLLPLEFIPDYNNGDYTQWVGADHKSDAQSCLEILTTLKFNEDDWFIVDHYGLDKSYESQFSEAGYKIGVIDDLVNRRHQCNFLLDQTCGRREEEYLPLVATDTQLFTGERFCLLRPEFHEYRELALERRHNFKLIRKVLINFGSTDPSNATTQVIRHLANYITKNNIKVTIVVGSMCPHLQEIQTLLTRLNANMELIIDAENIAQLISEADLAIGAAGATTWERCCLGLPTILIKTAENQNDVIERVAGTGAAISYDLNSPDRAATLEGLIQKVTAEYGTMYKNASQIVDGLGTLRIVNYLISGRLE